MHHLYFDYSGLDRNQVQRLGAIWLRTLASMYPKAGFISGAED